LKKLRLHEINQDTKIRSVALDEGWKGITLDAAPMQDSMLCIACNDAEVAQALSSYFAQLAKALKKGYAPPKEAT
jgi:hypothetical protein